MGIKILGMIMIWVIAISGMAGFAYMSINHGDTEGASIGYLIAFSIFVVLGINGVNRVNK